MNNLFRLVYVLKLSVSTFLYNLSSVFNKKDTKINKKILFATPIGKNDKRFFEKVIQKFGYEDIDYLVFVYDDTKFDEPIYKKCTFIYEKRFKWYCAKKYLTPEYCKEYAYIFIWDGDIDIENFSYKNLIHIMERNNLELAQPALSPASYGVHAITFKDEKYRIGRYTDFVEIMVPVFRLDAWIKFWRMIEEGYNFCGWGYDYLAKSFCGYHNLGIVDQEIVTHTKPVNLLEPREKTMRLFFNRYNQYKEAKMLSYGKLK